MLNKHNFPTEYSICSKTDVFNFLSHINDTSGFFSKHIFHNYMRISKKLNFQISHTNGNSLKSYIISCKMITNSKQVYVKYVRPTDVDSPVLKKVIIVIVHYNVQVNHKKDKKKFNQQILNYMDVKILCKIKISDLKQNKQI